MKNAKELFWGLMNAALVVVIILGIEGVYVLNKYIASLPITRTITVEGTAKTSIKPDLAQIAFSVIAEGKSPEALQKETKKMNNAIEFVKSKGVDAKDIKTESYSLNPKYSYNEKKGQSFIDGYTFTQSASVKTRNLESVGEIVSGLAGVGANEVNGPAFSVEDPEGALADVRAEAFEKAFDKAYAMARQNDARLGRVVTFSENAGGGYLRSYLAKSYEGMADVATPTIEPGTEELSVTVSVTYELR